MKNLITTFILFIVSLLSIQTGFAFESDPMLTICQARHSGKEFDDSQLITQDQIEMMIEAARQAPSSHNEQPWHMLICNKYTHPQAFAKLLKVMKASNQTWAQKAQILVLICAKTTYTKNKKENPFAQFDTGAAAISMALQATSLGLMAHQVGGFDTAMAISEFGIPTGMQPITLMVLGYEQAEATYISPERKQPSENFFYGQWKR